MQCEVCGRRIMGKPFRAVIEGAKMTVCNKCAKLASEYWEYEPKRRVKASAKPVMRTLQGFPAKRQPSTPLTATVELVDDFSLRVRKARESLGMSHEDLGRKIREKVSVLRKIESGKMVPDHGVTEKLEHALKVKLLVPPPEPKTPLAIPSHPHEVTLGELIQFKKEKAEANKERRQ